MVLLILSLGVAVTHVFPVISVPVTHIKLATFMDFTYGVFGWCYTSRHPAEFVQCTKRRIGYKYLDTNFYGEILYLPSESKYSISRLLVVHIIALINSIILAIMIFMITVTKHGDSPQFILSSALISLPLFVFSLFSFLVDILLFATHLGWPGWLMLADTVVMAFVCSLLWALRRTVSIRSYETLRETERYPMQHYQHSVQDIDESVMLEPLDEPISTYKTDNH
ncbi:regulator of ime2 [Maudiozyma exigua]|uniref:Regulator of ime2 n=1 Tax=Maudiozyma exigua TaxID=34358 RepID=A0A9P6WHT0_MAUEX|nr:regulator of ime2 [Kazachstania exigua]